MAETSWDCKCGHRRGLHFGGTGWCDGWWNEEEAKSCRCESYSPGVPSQHRHDEQEHRPSVHEESDSWQRLLQNTRESGHAISNKLRLGRTTGSTK